MKALVTGASGFIGGAVARALLRRKDHVRVLLRPGTSANLEDPSTVCSGLRPPPVSGEAGSSALEIVRGDLRDAQAVAAAVDGCDAVFHAGAIYSFSAPESEILAVNVGGTRNVVDAVRRSGVRMVYTSSIATVGGMHDGVLPDERSTPRGPPPGPYKRSKWEAEALVREEARRGLDVVIVNPTFPIGWGDVKPTPTGAVIRDFLDGKIPAYVDTGMNVVDVDDVADGELLAFERGQRGERYILGHGNRTMREFLTELAEVSQRKAPRLRIPHVLALGLAHADAFVTGRIRGRVPRIPLEGVRTAREIMFADCRRAVRELGLRQTPIREALAKAVQWFSGGAGFACAGRRPQAGAYDDERARREQRGVS
ncbi:MAG: NAD-dependent epimerase/dehydratase family protein [Myxococcales bacterium]